MNTRFSPLLLATALGAALSLSAPVVRAQNSAALARDFAQPPDATKPRCYWYWMDGMITKEGITRDLEAMKRVGIGEGYIGIIGGQSGTPPPGGPKALSPAWWSYIEHAVREGTRLGVDIGLFNSPGWSQSGGPWVKPTQAMRYVVLPELRLHGPQHFEGQLPTPPGEFQDLAVLAFPAPAGEGESAQVTARTPTSVSFEMPSPFTARSLTVQPVKPVNVTAELQVSDDGRQYCTLKRFPIDRHNLGLGVGPVPLAPVVASFPATAARWFRLQFSAPCDLGELRLSPAAREESYAEKSLLKMFQDPLPPFDYYQWPPQPEPDSADLLIRPETVRNLTPLLTPAAPRSGDSSERRHPSLLHWDVPPGDWVVLRAALTPTGTKNSPAPPEATGFEVDKMNRTALTAHFNAYVGSLLQRLPPDQRKSWKHVVADSYEQGPENWTDGFAADFQKRYGYDPLRFLPVMTGRLVGSADQSDRFLWDLRRLVAERVARDYVGALSDLCRQHGLRMWLENYGHWGFPSEFLLYGGYADEVAGEFWASGDLGRVELRDASSAAHIYGKPVIWSEAFTGGPAFLNTPRNLKALGDKAFCDGINQFMLHVYIHQPWEDRRPGVNAWFGTEFNRHNTWFEQSKAWIDYLRRCTVLLQAGRHVAEVAYFIGEDAPKMTGLRQPELPTGYDFDWMNADVIEHRMKVKNGRLVLPDGMSYRLLVLPPAASMRPELLRKLRDLVRAGATVLGPPPLRSPSLQDYPRCDEAVRQVAAELWGPEVVQRCAAGGSAAKGEHAFGKGRVLWGLSLEEAFSRLGIGPDFLSSSPLRYTHRDTGETHLYFVANPQDREVAVTAAFRVPGLAPELWFPDTGRIERAALYEQSGGRVRVPLQLGPHGSVFVVFRQPAEKQRLVAVAREGQSLLDLRSPLQLTAATATETSPTNTFTLAVWVKPAADTTLLPETNQGVHGLSETRNDVVFPPHGNTFGPGAQAGCGLAVGRNGVVVFEHAASYFAPVLVQALPLTNWTHIAIVYTQGRPSLYVNGALVHQGLASHFSVHPPPGGSGANTFRGELGNLEQFPRALSQADLAQLMKTSPAPGGRHLGLPLELSRNADGTLRALAWESGHYSLTTTGGQTRTLTVPAVPQTVSLSGPWEVHFASGSGAPDHATFDELTDWTQRPEEGIRHYSGTATYRKRFELPDALAPHSGTAVLLDLGQVHDLATVRLNGQTLRTLWLAPWRLDVTAALRTGENVLEIEVVNAWHNRLVGDKGLPAAQRHSFLTLDKVGQDGPLLPAGLLGPVTLEAAPVLTLGPGD